MPKNPKACFFCIFTHGLFCRSKSLVLRKKTKKNRRAVVRLVGDQGRDPKVCQHGALPAIGLGSGPISNRWLVAFNSPEQRISFGVKKKGSSQLNWKNWKV